MPDAAFKPCPRKRKKIWELASRWHCPLVGTCLPLAQMRKIAAREGYQIKGESDYDVHGLVVTQCHSRTDIAEQVQRYFDKQYAQALLRYGRIRDESRALAQWREDMAAGQDIAGALWAIWTHAELGTDTGEVVFGDVHMLSHQVGSQARADLRLLERLKKDHAELLKHNQHLRHEANKARQMKVHELAQLQGQLEAAQWQLAQHAGQQAQVQEAQQWRAEHLSLRERAQTMELRMARLDERNAQLQQRLCDMDVQMASLRAELAAAEGALAVFADDAGEEPICRSCPSAQQGLAGRCVLCIGGRQNLVNGYRRLVEAQKGRFMHHDGGQEESLRRIDAVVSGVDAVVCQSGCVSHGAYWKIKDACKKLDKPCVFVQSPGIASFARSLQVLSVQAGGSASTGSISSCFK